MEDADPADRLPARVAADHRLSGTDVRAERRSGRPLQRELEGPRGIRAELADADPRFGARMDTELSWQPERSIRTALDLTVKSAKHGVGRRRLPNDAPGVEDGAFLSSGLEF